MGHLTPVELSRFQAKTRWEGKCLVWTGYRQPDGYGRVTVRSKQWKAHRLAYRDAWGKIPEGMIVRHKCDNPSCVNPTHLELGTDADNCRDRDLRGRASTKIGPDEVIAIRSDTRTYREIADEYSITPSNVCLIKKRQTWQHVGG